MLYAMFGTTTAFDWLLSDDDKRLKLDEKGHEVQKELRAVVESYRKNGFVRAEEIDTLRNLLTFTGKHGGKQIDIEECHQMLFQHLVKPDAAKPHRTYSVQIFPRDGIALNYANHAQAIRQLPATDVQTLLNDVDDLREMNLSDLIENEVMLFMPTHAGEGQAYSQIIPNDKITWIDPKNGYNLKMQLVSYITIGDYDPASTEKVSRSHFRAFSFDREGNGYHFDSMGKREDIVTGKYWMDFGDGTGEWLPEIAESKNVPTVEFLPQFSRSLQEYKLINVDTQLEVQELSASEQAARVSVHNLYVCFYRRIKETGDSRVDSRPGPSSTAQLPPPIQQAAPIYAPPVQPALTNAIVFVECNAGLGNHLVIKGEGIDDLNWKEGQQMECVGEGTSWMIACSSTDLSKAKFKILKVKPDGTEIWENSEDRSFDATRNGTLNITPHFNE